MAKRKSERPTRNGLGTRLLTPRLLLRPPAEDHGASIARALRRNAAHLARVSPSVPPSSSLVAVAQRVAAERREFTRGTTFAFYAFTRLAAEPSPAGEPPDVVAKVVLNGVHRGAMQGAYLGYWVDAQHEGQGLAYEAVRAVIEFAMTDAMLHRLQAAIQPWNARSVALVRRLGFRHEGLARRYLDVGGGWQDHEIYALTSEEWRYGPAPV